MNWQNFTKTHKVKLKSSFSKADCQSDNLLKDITDTTSEQKHDIGK